jgi:hypothetical protein
VVAGSGSVFVDRGHFELTRSDFVVSGLDGNAESPQVFLDFLQTREHTAVNGTEVVVLHFLALRRLSTEDGTAK